MKLWMIFVILFAVCGLNAQTYRAGGASQSSFGEEEAQQNTPNASEEGSKTQTKTFSSYGSRSRDWGKGVQTQSVRTSMAGTPAPDQAEAKADKAAAAIKGKKGAASPAAAPKAGASAPADAAAGQPDPSAMLKQVQDMMKGMSTGVPAAPASAGAATTPGKGGSAAGMPAGMNVPGMPDLSALMGAAAAGAQPAKK